MPFPEHSDAPQPVWQETAMVLTSVRLEYGEVSSYFFKPEHPVTFSAGSYAHVRLFGMPEGVKAVREFSFASSPSERELMFTIDSRSGSPYQVRLREMVPGEKAGIFKIKTHMTWPPGMVEEVVMIAGGIGVTPFRSMLLDRKERGVAVQARVLHVARSEYVFKDELSRLADEYVTLGREGAAARIRAAAKEAKDSHFYIAGSPSFVEAAKEIIESTGVTRIESDAFKGFSDSTPLLDLSDL